MQRKIDELERARAAISKIAKTDALTGLPNRREFDDVAGREWRRALRERTPLSVLLIDADCFKQVNDRFGHAEGDRVLRELADRIRTNLLRPADFAARYGGEEFAVILPNTDANGAMMVAEAIRSAVSAWRERAGAIGNDREVTVSIGVSSIVPLSVFSFNQLVTGADQALYKAKEGGRNRSQLAEMNFQQIPIVESVLTHERAVRFASVGRVGDRLGCVAGVDLPAAQHLTDLGSRIDQPDVRLVCVVIALLLAGHR